jgi:hypothetical protein
MASCHSCWAGSSGIRGCSPSTWSGRAPGSRSTTLHRPETWPSRPRTWISRARWPAVGLRRFPTGLWFAGHYALGCYGYSDPLMEQFREQRSRDSVDFVYAQKLTGMDFVRARRAGESLSPVGINAHGCEMWQRRIGLKARLGQLPMRPLFRHATRNADVVASFCWRDSPDRAGDDWRTQGANQGHAERGWRKLDGRRNSSDLLSPQFPVRRPPRAV